MAHYFTKDNHNLPSQRKEIFFVINNRKYNLLTDSGVFSKAGLDFGTRVLLEAIIDEPHQSVLDLGCGYGPIGIVLADIWRTEVTMIDINQRAVELANENAKKVKVNITAFQSDGFEQVQGLYDMIVTNPPIRTGKKVIYGFFREAKDYLSENGVLVIVINKNQGALSAINELETIYSKVEVIAKKSGYFVIKCQK